MSFIAESNERITAPGFEVGWGGSDSWNGMVGWVFDQRVYTEYLLLRFWSGLAGSLFAGDFSDDTRFSKPLVGAGCPWVADGNSAAGCETGATTYDGGRARSCSGGKCGVLAFGAPSTALCRSPGCEAKESVSQTISIPWNAKELKFKHRRANAGGISSIGSWARLVINRPGIQAAVPPACQVCPGSSGTLSEGPCDFTGCALGTDWTYTPPLCPIGSACPRTSTGSDVLWDTYCDSVGNGDIGSDVANLKCSMPCEDKDQCTDDEILHNFLEETIDLTPYVYDIDAATSAPGTCATTVVAACVGAGADEATCTGVGACTFTENDNAAPTCTTTTVPGCADANTDATTCAAAGACTYTPAAVREDYASRRQKLIDHGDTTWTISFQAKAIDVWAVYVDDLTMTFKRPGCTDPLACNYDRDAEIDDGTCVAKAPGCTDNRSPNFDPSANIDPGDMCITFGRGEAPTLQEVQLGSTQHTPTLMIPTGRYTVTGDDGSEQRVSLQGLRSNVKYPYWSHQIMVSPDAAVEDSPVGLKINSEFADDLTLLVYEQFTPNEPRRGLVHTARIGCGIDWQVKCENAAFFEEPSNICPDNGLVRTILAGGQVYTVVVIPKDAEDYQADATGQAALSQRQGKFDLRVFAARGAIQEIPPVCGNGVVEGSLEQCDPKSGAEAEWCTPSPCSGTATDMSTYRTGPTEFPHWYTPAYHCVAAYASAVQAGSSGLPEDCPSGCEWSGHGGCQGIAASFSFEEESISLSEGEKRRIKIKRRRPPNWLPHMSSRVRVKVYTADGEGPNAAHAEGTDGADDYDEIKAEFLDFEACTDGESLSCMEQFLEIETFADSIFEYPTEHFYVILDLYCDEDDGCSQSAKLEYPAQLRVDIVNDPWAPSDFIVAAIVMLGIVMLGITVWLTSWINGAHLARYDKLARESAEDFEGSARGEISPTGSASPSFRSNSIRSNGSPSFRANSIRSTSIRSTSIRSNSIAPADLPSFEQRRAALAGAGQYGSGKASAVADESFKSNSSKSNSFRSNSIAPSDPSPSFRQRRAALAGAGQHSSRRTSVVAGETGTRRASVALGAEGARRQRATNLSGGKSFKDAMDEEALAALHESVEGTRKIRSQSYSSRRKGSISTGDGQPSLELASRVKGGDGVKSSSGRRRRGSVREIEPEDEPTSATSKTSQLASGSSRRRRASVKEISLEPPKKEITLGRSDSHPKESQSSGRRRRASVQELLTPAVKQISAAAAFAAAGQQASSSGRRRRGSVKEIELEHASVPAPAPQSSGRRRRGSVREIDLDSDKIRSKSMVTDRVNDSDRLRSKSMRTDSSARRRRASVNEAMTVIDTANAGAAHLTSASVRTSRRRGTSESAGSDLKGTGRGTFVAAGGSHRGSTKLDPPEDMDGYPPGVVSKLSLVDSGGSLSKSRRQRARGNTSPTNGLLNIGGKSPQGVARASSASDGTASPAARDAEKESSRPKRGGVGGYTNAAMFHAMQAALAQSEHILDENKGLVGKLKLTGSALLGALFTAATTVVFLNLTSSELDSCEAVSDGQCLEHMVGNGHCDWECNIDECNYDGDDCEFYTDTCRFAWYHYQNTEVHRNGADVGRDACYFEGALSLSRLNDNNAFISPVGTRQQKKPIENNVVMGCFSLEQVGGALGPDNPPTLTSRRLKDGKCDPACNFEACGWDGGDCEEARLKASPQCSEGCYSHMMGDRHCDPACDTESCFFDLRDCTASYNQWVEDTAAQAQKPVPVGLPEALICDRETLDPTQTQCGLMNDAEVLNAIHKLNFDDDNNLKDPTHNGRPDPARSVQDFIDEACDEDEPLYVYENCKTRQETEYNGYLAEVATNWRIAAEACPSMAAAISKLHRETQVNSLVATLTHAHTCQERCDTPSCGHDAGACYDDYWCAPGCSHDKLLNLVCDQECFSAACGWDAPACNSCDAFVDPEAGLYKDVINSLADTNDSLADTNESSIGINMLLLAIFLLSAVILVLRIRSTIIIALDGFFEPMGNSLGRIWNKEEMGEFDSGSTSKASVDRYTAPVWPVAYAGPLLAEPKNDWTENEDEYNEDTGRYGLQYHNSAADYSSEDSEPMRLELHQAQTAALATALSIVFVLSLPVTFLVAGAEPRLAGVTQLTELSIGNLFDPETACEYPLGMYELLSNNLNILWADSADGPQIDGKPQCGPASLAVHAFLLADMLATTCLLLLLRSRHQDLERLRRAHPRLSDYCVHISGLGRGTKLASDVDRMIKQVKWLNEKDHADDVTVVPIWQDDLYWAWASLQKAHLDAVGSGESTRGDELKNLVHKLEGSRSNVAYPRPFSGHAICIFNKQYMARAMLHRHKMPVVQMLLKLLLPGEDLGGESEAGEKKSKVKVMVQRGGDPDDIDWLSFRSGGSASFTDTWRGRVARIGALLSLVSVLMLSLAILSRMKQVDLDVLNEAMATSNAKQKASETLQALTVPPFACSLLIVLLTELGAWIVTVTATRAAPYKAHTYSAQRKSVLVWSSFAQVCTLVLFPYMLLGDPFSWHSAGSVSATSVFAKCKPVIEKAVNQELPGADFIPSGFAEMALWLQVWNALLPHLLGLMNFSHWPRMFLEAMDKAHGTAHGWEFEFSLETSESYIVRTVALALSFSVVQPVGIALAAVGLLIGYSVDRLRARRCTPSSSRSMRRGAGVGDVYDQQVVLTLLQSVVTLHALLLCCWIDSVRLAENPFIVNSFSVPTIWLYPILEILVVLISLGAKAQGTACWLIMSYFLVTFSYTLIPLAGSETELFFGLFAFKTQPGGPNIVAILTTIFSGVVITPFFRPMSWFMGPLDPIAIATKAKRESDEEAYYTAAEMPFKPKSVIDDLVKADVASILSRV